MKLPRPLREAQAARVPPVRLRIFSDLHYAEPPSRITDLRMIAPLLEGPERLVLNGDSVDTRFVATDPAAAAGLARFEAFIAPWRDRLTLVTGNHDPYISPHHHLELAGGRILITHGDVLFPSVAPWGWEAAHVIAARERRLRELDPAHHGTFETELALTKHASYATRHLVPAALREAGTGITRVMRLAERVRRADRIITAWMRTPTLAAALAARHRPEARLVVIGHTHFPGVWRRAERIVINTGAFTPPLGARLVDLYDDRIDIRAVTSRAGEFRPGDIVRTLRPERDLPPETFAP